jgi:hypothetical protein
MTVTISITEIDFLEAARNFLLLILPSNVEVVQGQNNRVGEPVSDNFIVMTSMAQNRMGTNEDAYDETAGTLTMNASMEMVVQLDIHGPESSTLTMLIATAWRDIFGVDNTDSGVIVPLYTDDPKQMAFINGESQWESRWVMNLYLQAKPAVSTAAQFLDIVTITLNEVDQ